MVSFGNTEMDEALSFPSRISRFSDRDISVAECQYSYFYDSSMHQHMIIQQKGHLVQFGGVGRLLEGSDIWTESWQSGEAARFWREKTVKTRRTEKQNTISTSWSLKDSNRSWA